MQPILRANVHHVAWHDPQHLAIIREAPRPRRFRGLLLRALKPQQFVDDRFGLPTVTDILTELEKPGRDPRPEFRTATFAEGVHKIADLRPGMVL